MADEGLTREDFISQYGFDPEAETTGSIAPATPKPSKGAPGLSNAARDMATGFITTLPDFLSLPGTVKAAAGAAYDKYQGEEFGKSFAKRLRVDDADARTGDFLRKKQQEWKQQYPDMSAADLQDLSKQFLESKEFEDFNTELLRDPLLKFSTKFKSGVRETLGDTRSDKERSWVDSGLEIVGGSLFGIGPGLAAKGAKAIAANRIGAALTANPVSYAALRTAEALTPITLPLTPGNVAINSAAGIAIDQGLRYAMGDTTVFSENDSTLAGLAEVTAATGAGAAVIAAMRGRAARVASQLAPNNTPQMADAIAQGAPGGAALVAGRRLDEFGDGPPVPALQGGSIIKQSRDLARRAQGQVVDEFRPTFDLIEQVHGKSVARQTEALFSNLTGAGGRDAANADAASAMRGLMREVETYTPEEVQQFKAGWLSTVAESRNLQVEKRYNDDIAVFAQKQQAGTLTTKEAGEFADAQAKLQRFQADDPDTRRMMPDIPRLQVQEWDNFFKSNPRFAAARDAIVKMNDDIMNEAVSRGNISRSEAAEMRAATPFYAPLQQDPLEGATGVKRLATGFLQSFSKEKTEAIGRANKPLLSSVDTEIKDSGEIARITKPLDPVYAYSVYARNMYLEMQNNTARRAIIDALEKDPAGNPSKYMADNNIQRLESNSRVEFTNAELRTAASGQGNPALQRAINDPNTIRVQRNGLTSFYTFGDPEVAALMRLEPTMYTGWTMMLGKPAADAFKMNTTGALAPVFAPINALYDTTMGGAIRPADRAFGPLDTAMRKVFGETIGTQLGGRVFDPTAYAALPWHVIAGMGEVAALRAAKFLSQDMANNGVMRDVAQAIGIKNYDILVTKMLLAAERSKTIMMMDKGITHNAAFNDLPEALNAFNYAASAIPQSIRGTYSFYKDLVNAVHSAPKREFWSQNYSLLEQKFGIGKIPQAEIDRLIYDTRALAGDMTRRAGSQMMQRAEAVTPYLAPMRNGVYAMARGVTNADTAQYVWPRLTMMMSGIMASFYMMSNWDDKASDEFWKNTPEWMRYRYLHVPTMELMSAWARGEKPGYDPKLIYKMPIGPDLAPIIAGTSAFLRGIGALPNGPSRTASSGLSDFGKMTLDMVTPVFPPVVNAPLAMMGAQVDIGGADARGGNFLKVAQQNPFRRGPQEEAASNLGEMNSFTQNMLGTLFGANGTYLSRAYDAFMHASKFDATKNDPKTGLNVTRVGGSDYYAGLKAATTTFTDQTVRRVPDVPLLWKGNDKQYTQTPVQIAISEEKLHLSSIKGIRDSADLRALGSKASRANDKRAAQANEGGIVQRYLTDPALLAVADDIRKWQGDRQPFGQLKQEYGTLASIRRSLEANYSMPRDQRMEKINALIDKMQDNQEQQRLAIMFKVQEINEKYGASIPALASVKSMKDVDRLLRAAIQ